MGIVLLGLLLLASLPRGHGYCTCPDAGTCGVADLFSPGGDSECVPSAEGIIAADVAIENTAALATVDLSGVVAISGDLRFVGNAALVGIIATSLVLVDDDIIVRGNALLVNLNLPAFAGSVEDSDDILLVEQNPILEVVSLPSLIDSERDIQIGGNNANTGNPLLFTIDLSNLVTARGFMDFTGNARMEELLLGSLTTVGGYFYIGSTGIGSFNNLPALELPNLVSVGNHFFLQYLEEMSVLDLSSLESTGDYLIISAASSLVSLDLPAFTSAGGSIAGRAVSFDGPWDALQSINLPSLASTLDVGTVYIRPNQGMTDLALDLSSFEGGALCVRSSSTSIGPNGQPCNFPIRGQPDTTAITSAPKPRSRLDSDRPAVERKGKGEGASLELPARDRLASLLL